MNAYQNRRAEDQEQYSYTRDDRFFSLENMWYFTTREGLVMGPYESRKLAIEEAEGYIRFACSAGKLVLNIMKRETLTIPGNA